MDINLKNKKAIVCGSTQGIGKAVALELASLGAEIILVARDEKKLGSVRSELDTNAGQKHEIICVDFNKPDELRTKINGYVCQVETPDTTSTATIHILVNNTGGPKAGAILEAQSEEFMQGFSNHLICNQILVQAVVPLMKKAGYGRIINIISTSVKQPIPGLGVSNTIRGAVASWAKTLSAELGPFGITVNNILPGYTDTVRLESLIKNKAKKLGKAVDEIKKDMISSIPALRLAKPEEIAAAAAFLASPAASYINGINLPVDGGRLGCL
ncbi:MAG: SDR family oxidoreductase [Cytophagales bacterium]|nr:SDR family oxidoreductase [Cytophagales bacterium]